MYVDQSSDICDNFDLPEFLGNITPVKLLYPKTIQNNDITRIQRIFTGDDATSVGTMYTNREGPTRFIDDYPATATTTDVTNTYTSSITNIHGESDIKLQAMHDEINTLKEMIHTLIQHSSNQINSPAGSSLPMQLDSNNGNQMHKRKAGDSNESTCEDA